MTLRNLTVLFTLALLAGLAVIWHWQPALPKAEARAAASQPWGMQEQRTIDADALMATLEKSNLWGATLPQTEAKPLTTSDWRILGSATNGPDRFVMIKFTDAPAAQLKEGDNLPGGARILKISPDSLAILLNGKPRTLRIYRE